jgi:hypothetical protein
MEKSGWSKVAGKQGCLEDLCKASQKKVRLGFLFLFMGAKVSEKCHVAFWRLDYLCQALRVLYHTSIFFCSR